MGSDDYFTKPFSPVKLVTKVKSILQRREAVQENKELDSSTLTFADISLNIKNKTATLKDDELQLTPNEYALLSYLIINKDRAIPRMGLLDKIWGYETEVETRVADDTVKRLRKKIIDSDALISTVWGYGFRLENKNEAKSE